MHNLLVHRSHPRTRTGMATSSPAIINDKEQTPMCGPWRWRIPKFRIAPAVRSIYFRLRGRTPVTTLKSIDMDTDNNVSYGRQRSPSRRSNEVERQTPSAFSTNSIECPQTSTSNQCSPVTSSSSLSRIRDVSSPSRFSLPGAVGESKVFATLRSDTLHESVSATSSQTSDHDEDGMPGNVQAKTILFHEPKYNFQSNSDHLIYQHVGIGLDNDETALDATSKPNLTDFKIDTGAIQNKDDDRDIIQDKSMNTLSKEENPFDILAITHAPSPSSDTDSDVEINIQGNDEQEVNIDEVSEPRPYSRMERECWVERQPSPVQAHLTVEECVGIGSSVDFSKPDDTNKEESSWDKSQEKTVEKDSELEEELDYYEDNDEEHDDYLDMDKVLRKCPPTEVLQNLRDMVQLSKNTTSQLEKALRRAARIACGPFPRLPGSGLTKTEVIDHKCAKLVGETEDFLGDMNKNFLTFYTVLEQMDKVSAQQDSFVSSILVKRGPRDWRRGHAAILRKMDKLWSRYYPKVITRKLKGSIQETIYEVDE